MGKKKRPTPQPAEATLRVPGGLVDAHTHLASCRPADAALREGFDDAPVATRTSMLMDAAAAAGVAAVCTVGDTVAESREVIAAAHADPRVFGAVAIHPTRANELDQAAKAALEEMARDERCVAVGETGLDYYWLQQGDPDVPCASKQEQEESLRWHAELASRVGKTLMIHNREADEDLLAIVGECLSELSEPPTVVLHCFSSPVEVAQEALDRGYVLSFSGNVTFKRNEQLRQALALAPRDQYLIETDAPYMTPEPFRGSRNLPSYIGHTYLCAAAARGISVEQVAEETRATFRRVYGLG